MREMGFETLSIVERPTLFPKFEASGCSPHCCSRT
jgi:hypothetical protein